MTGQQPPNRDDRASRQARGYDSNWDKARAAYLRAHPLCVYCERLGIVEAASVVDHIVPHRGDMVLFWDSGNWQSLCKPHHDATKQREEHAGAGLGCDLNGNPIDSRHHWNAKLPKPKR